MPETLDEHIETPFKKEAINTSYRSILKVAVPIGMGTFVQFFVLFFDNLFIRELNDYTAFNAANESGIFYIVGVMIGVGLSAGVQILTARRVGENKIKDIGRIVSNGLNIAIFSSFILYGLYFFLVEPVLGLVFEDQNLANIMVEFLNIRSLGYFALFPLIIFNGFFSGIAKTKILFYVALITGLGNIALDYLLIFGKFGFPELGVMGAAWASAIAESMALIYAIGYVLIKKYNVTYYIKDYFKLFRISKARELVKISYPIAITQIVSLSTWSIFFIMIENVGEDELSVSNIVRNMMLLAFIAIFGFNRTAKTYVSTLTAENRIQDILPTLKKMMKMSFIATFVLTSILWINPELIMSIFKAEELTDMASGIFLIIVPSMLMFSIGGIFFATVDGFGDTLVSMAIEILSIIIYISALVYLVKIIDADIQTIWLVDLLYFFLLGSFSFIYLRFGKRKHIFS